MKEAEKKSIPVSGPPRPDTLEEALVILESLYETYDDLAAQGRKLGLNMPSLQPAKKSRRKK